MQSLWQIVPSIDALLTNCFVAQNPFTITISWFAVISDNELRIKLTMQIRLVRKRFIPVHGESALEMQFIQIIIDDRINGFLCISH